MTDELDIFPSQLLIWIMQALFTLFTNYNWLRWLRCYFLRVICVKEFSHGVLFCRIPQHWVLLIRIHLIFHSLREELLTYRQPLLCLQHFGLCFLRCHLFLGNRRNLGPMRLKLHVLRILDLLNSYIALIKPIIHLGYLQPKCLLIITIKLLKLLHHFLNPKIKVNFQFQLWVCESLDKSWFLCVRYDFCKVGHYAF